GFNSISTNTAMQKGRWYHIAATFKAKVEMRIYVNGVLENTQTISGDRAANNNPLTIGTSAIDRTRNFAGLIDEAQMYNRALSTAEIQSIFNADSAGKTVILTLLPYAQSGYGVDALQGSAIVYLSGRVPTQDVLLTSIAPNKGGNSGSVTPVIYGQGFKPGVTVRLVRAGQPDIVATQTNPAADEASVAATFDLKDQPQGVYDVVVANAG